MRQTKLIAMALFLTTSLGLACSDDPTAPEDQQPVLGSISPDSGNVGTGVDISGSAFAPGAVVMFGDKFAPKVTYISTTKIRAYAPSGIVLNSTYSVRARNASSDFAEASRSFKAVAPELLVVNGVSRPSGLPGSLCILEGRSFGDLLGTGEVYFTGAGGPIAAVVESGNWNNEFIIATVPSDAQSGPVWVETPLGVTASIDFIIAEETSFSPSDIFWTQTASLPYGSQGHEAHFIEVENNGNVDNLVFVTGGADGTPTPRADVVVGEIDGAGQIVSWDATTAFPAPRAFHGSATATPYSALIDTVNAGYLYALGGIDNNGDVLTSVVHAAVGKDNSLGLWTETTPLPIALHSAGVTVFRSWVYVVGGAKTGNVPSAAAYRARIQFDGTLGSWQSMASLPAARAYAPLVQFGGHLYVLGGDTGTNAPGANNIPNSTVKSIVTQAINLRTGGLQSGSWSTAGSSLIKASTKHSVIVAGGWLLASGGLYNGAGSSATEHQYAEIDTDGSVKSFNGATGSETIVGGAGGVPFYNHAAITYVDDAGIAHVLIIGGGNVGDGSAIGACYFY